MAAPSAAAPPAPAKERAAGSRLRPPRLTLVTPPDWHPADLRRALPGVVALAGALPAAARADLGVLLRLPLAGLPALAEAAAATRCLADLGVEIGANTGVRRSEEEARALVLALRGSPVAVLQLPEQAGPPLLWRSVLGSDSSMLLSRSCHDPAGLVAARRGGADRAWISPIFATSSKPGQPPLGLAVLRQCAELWPGRVVALGGIDSTCAAAALATGAAGVAAVRAAWADLDALRAACCP
jgi:hypothetical protein